MEAFRSGGVIMWPMLAVAAGITWLAVRTTIRLRQDGSSGDEVQQGLYAILFWGVLAGLLGALGTITGLIQIAQAIVLAGSVEPTLVWGGVGVSLVSLVFGILIFLFAALGWFALHSWSTRVAARA